MIIQYFFTAYYNFNDFSWLIYICKLWRHLSKSDSTFHYILTISTTRTCVQTSTHSIDCFFCKQINSLRSIWHLDRVWYHVLYKHTVFSSFVRNKELEASVMGLIHTHLHPSHFELLDALRVFLMLEVSFWSLFIYTRCTRVGYGPTIWPKGWGFPKTWWMN